MSNNETRISNERLAEMLAGLEGVTPGPWVPASNHSIHRTGDLYSNDGYVEALDGYCVEAPTFDDHVTSRAAIAIPEDAAHIANCDPDTIRAMILELQALRSTPVEGEPLGFVSRKEIGLLKEWSGGDYVAGVSRRSTTRRDVPVYTSHPLPNPSPSDGEVSDRVLELARDAYEDFAGEIASKQALRLAINCALQSKRGQP